MSFKDDFEKIVIGIAKQAQEQATSFADRIEALKALNVSYGLMMKHAKEDDDSDGFDFSKGITEEQHEEPSNGTAKVRTRPRGN